MQKGSNRKLFCFITDTHFTSSSNVRVGDYHKDLMDKLQYVVHRCNEADATLLIGGDVFDRPTVPDFVVSDVISILINCINKPIAVAGNHDILYNSMEYFHKTSLRILEESKLIHILKSSSIEVRDVFITNEKPLTTRNRVQIGIFHGFLNQEDGNNSFFYQDILTEDSCCILLGHDHCVYDPVSFNNSRIFRPGSFARGIRNDSNERIPQMLWVLVEGDSFKAKLEPIKVARSVELLFKTKDISHKREFSYDSIIEQIKGVKDEELTLKSALKLVAKQDVVDYIDSINNKLQTKKSNK